MFETAEQLRSHTLNMLLCNAMHREMPLKIRAEKIKSFCKRLLMKTGDKPLKRACRQLIKEKNYGLVVQAIENAEASYWGTY